MKLEVLILLLLPGSLKYHSNTTNKYLETRDREKCAIMPLLAIERERERERDEKKPKRYYIYKRRP